MASWHPDTPPPVQTRRQQARNLAIVFLVGLILTLALLVLAGQRDPSPTAGWTWDDRAAL